ncbi:MAG: LysE family transporter [Aggregatilineales bacterium]
MAAPVGPIGVLCIRRTLAKGRLYGLVSGLGAASADAFFGTIAAFGLTAISTVLVDNRALLGLFGGLFLLYLGIKTWFTPPSEEAASASARGLITAYTSTLFLALTNPITILAFIAIFTTLSTTVDTNITIMTSSLIVLGVFVGSAAWWIFLSTGVSFFRDRFDTRMMGVVNKFSSVIITLFGAYALLSLL